MTLVFSLQIWYNGAEEKERRKHNMVKHVVMWKFKEIGERNTKEQNLDLACEKLSSLQGLVPQIKSLSVGKNKGDAANNYDLVLIVDFDNRKDLAAYLEHPEHQKVANFIKKVKIGKVAVDYEF